MFTRITRLLEKNRKTKIIFLVFCFSLLSLYPIFRNFYYANGILTYERHIAFLEKRSEFYNPWQYRIFCPFMVEGLIWTYDHTLDKIFPLEEKVHFKVNSTTGTTGITDQFIQLTQNKEAFKYVMIFILFRFAEHLGIFFLGYILWSYFIRNDWLLFFGLIFLSLAMGNSVAVADLTLNTYIDIILYQLAACLILYKKNPLWLIPIITIGALNRETSLMIPFLYFVSCMDFSRLSWKKFSFGDIGFPKTPVWVLVFVQYVIFFTLFFWIRNYYGYRPQHEWKVPAGLQMLRLNLLSPIGLKSYFEMIGTFGVIPFIILYKFRRFPSLLKLWFLAIVPIWFFVHLLTVVTYQTRLFLVPTILIFLPMMMWLIENNMMQKPNRAPAA